VSAATVSVQPNDVLPTVPSGTWQIDPAHSTVGFAVRHLMGRVRGTFPEFSGEITLADDRLDSSVRVQVDLASVSTGNNMRDSHLRTRDFFAVDEYPTMTFASTAVREAGESWVLEGDLTIRGTTRTVRIDLDYLGYDPTGQLGEPRIGFEGRTSINRSDYGVSFGLVDGGKIVVADQVDVLLGIEAVYEGPTAAAEAR
jgi:polyisoprenoid-binding protein YceI